LNRVTFETLRQVGLSVNQAARFIGQRDQRRGFSSVADVDRVVGIPQDVKDTLKEQGTV
jgi:DNA uptake protein ComE-like DNA-binding protein